jgi:HSP20 family protein
MWTPEVKLISAAHGDATTEIQRLEKNLSIPTSSASAAVHPRSLPSQDLIRVEERIMYRSFFPRDVYAELARLQRAFAVSPGIRGQTSRFADSAAARSTNDYLMWPAMNVGTTPQSVEVHCFAPGIDPNGIDVSIEQGVLTIAGERKSDLLAKDDKRNLHIDERFAGKFRRVVTLPEDADPDAVQASYRDGVLHISVQRRQAAQPRRITVQ